MILMFQLYIALYLSILYLSYSLNYILLRNLVLKVRSFYPLGLYKIRGFFVHGESIKIIPGKSRLGSSFGYYG